MNVVPYHPRKGDGTIWVLSYATAAEDSSAVMDGPKEPAHGHLDGQRGGQREKDGVVKKDKMKHPNHPAEVGLKIPERKVNGQTLKEEKRQLLHTFDLST